MVDIILFNQIMNSVIATKMYFVTYIFDITLFSEYDADIKEFSEKRRKCDVVSKISG